MPRLGLAAKAFIALIIFTVINPYGALDVAVLFLIIFVIFYKILGDYALLTLLAARPTLDLWRDQIITTIGGVSINFNIVLAILLLVWSGYFFYQHRDYWQKIPLKFFWAAFLIWCAASYFWSYDQTATIAETIKTANLFALFGMAYILGAQDKEKFSRRFIVALLMAGVIPAVMAFYQFFTHTGANIDGTPNRLFGTFAHPNILSTFSLLIVICLCGFYWEQKQKISAGKIGAAAAIFLFLIIAAYTRATWLALTIFALLVGTWKNRRAAASVALTIAALYLSFFPINKFLISQYNRNLQTNPLIARLTYRNPEADSIKWRADIVTKVLPLWVKRPLIGYGYGAFAKVWDDNKGVANLWDNTSEAHNEYLKVGFETGAIGLVFFILIFLALLRRAWRQGRANHDYIFLFSVLAYLILSASDNMLHHTPVIWWWWALWGMWSAKKN